MDELEKIDREIAALRDAIDDVEFRINELRDELEPMLDRLQDLEEQRIDAEDMAEAEAA